MRGQALPYVSRGGLKLEKAMKSFPICLDGAVCMDVGASTGGFTDCMLQNGAKKVYAVDVGHGQLAWKLRNDPRVVCMEKTNIRYVKPEDIGEPVDFSSIDVSFISLTMVLGPVRESVSLLMAGNTDYEFRTTTVAELHDEDSFRKIGEWIRGAKRYFLQKFTDRDTVPFEGFHAPADEEMRRYLEISREYVPSAELRGVD